MTQSRTPGDVGAVVDALASHRRRLLLYYLRGRGGVTVEDAATAVGGWLAARSDDRNGSGPPSREEVLAALHHVDLPKLEAAGLVSRAGATVRYEGSQLAEELLAATFEHERLGPEVRKEASFNEA